MNEGEKAQIILESLDKYIQIDWNNENMYLKAIVEGLVKIKNLESKKSEKII